MSLRLPVRPHLGILLIRLGNLYQRRGRRSIQLPESLTHGALWEATVPPILQFDDLAIVIDVDPHDRVDCLLLLDQLDRVRVLQLELDRVPARRNLVALDLDGVEQGGQAVPLRLVAISALGD